MSEQILVTVDAVRQAADDMQTATMAMREHLAEMTARLRPLAHDWTGAASIAYQESQREWNYHINEMVELLEALTMAVQQSGRTYQSTEEEVRAAWA